MEQDFDQKRHEQGYQIFLVSVGEGFWEIWGEILCGNPGGGIRVKGFFVIISIGIGLNSGALGLSFCLVEKDFNVTPQWLGKVLRYNNKTRKRTRHEHFPTTKYNKPIDKK